MKITGMDEFQDIAKQQVAYYTYGYYERVDQVSFRLSKDDIYCVWSCKALKNFKGLFATPVDDGLYFEITYNGDKGELYFDCYKKLENKVIR